MHNFKGVVVILASRRDPSARITCCGSVTLLVGNDLEVANPVEMKLPLAPLSIRMETSWPANVPSRTIGGARSRVLALESRLVATPSARGVGAAPTGAARFPGAAHCKLDAGVLQGTPEHGGLGACNKNSHLCVEAPPFGRA